MHMAACIESAAAQMDVCFALIASAQLCDQLCDSKPSCPCRTNLAGPFTCQLEPTTLPQDPELICSSVNDLGQTISVSCGTWSTWWRQASGGRYLFTLRF